MDELARLPLAEGGNAESGGSYEAEAAAINRRFRQECEGARRQCRPWEWPAVLRGLEDRRALSLLLMRERRARERLAEREARRRRRPSPQPM